MVCVFMRHYISFCNAGLRPYPLDAPSKAGDFCVLYEHLYEQNLRFSAEVCFNLTRALRGLLPQRAWRC